MKATLTLDIQEVTDDGEKVWHQEEHMLYYPNTDYLGIIFLEAAINKLGDTLEDFGFISAKAAGYGDDELETVRAVAKGKLRK